MTEHVDMGMFIAPKSDQMNADDLIGGPLTITITRVTGNEGNAEQPVNVFYDGDNGKPYRPCKSMRRVMVAVWGRDASKYVGRVLTLYRDAEVSFGGMKVGGIRISHMSHIDEQRTMALTAAKARRAQYTVRPLANPPAGGGNGNRDKAEAWLKGYLANPTDTEATRKTLAKLKAEHPDLYAKTQPQTPAGDDYGTDDADPFRAAADRLISKAKTGEVFDDRDAAALNALPEQYRAEVDAACETA